MMISALFCVRVNAQQLDNIDRITPFHDGLAAVEMDGKWGFINAEGDLVVDFRNDLVLGQQCPKQCAKDKSAMDYPVFHKGRALVKVNNDGIAHYGYIDKTGKMVIAADFLNATHFSEQGAIVLKLYKENIGNDVAMGKNMIVYSYNEEVINTDGEVIMHLRGPMNITYSKANLKTPPAIASKFMNEGLMATRVDKRWTLKPINK